MKKHVWFKKQTLVFISTIIVSCGQVKDEAVLTIAISSDIRGFDPAMAVDIRTGGVISLVFPSINSFAPTILSKSHVWGERLVGSSTLFIEKTTSCAKMYVPS